MAAILDSDEVTYINNKDPNRPLSRYNKIRFLLTEEDPLRGKEAVAIQESWDSLTIPELANDRMFRVGPQHKNRPDLVSLEVYGTEQLYWVIAYANQMIDPFAECIVGKRLRIPDRENLFHTILAK